MKLKIQITMDNAAFEEAQGRESARILRELAERIEDSSTLDPGLWATLHDMNGNKVGTAKVIH